MSDQKFGIRELILIALCASISGVTYTLLGQPWLALSTAFGPLGGAALGLFQYGHLLAFALIPRRGVAFSTSVLATATQFLIGDPTGVMVMGWGVAHGLGAELTFAVTGYRRPAFLTLFVAGGVGACLGQFFSLYLYGWAYTSMMFGLSLLVVFLASGIESGGLAYAVRRTLRQRSESQ